MNKGLKSKINELFLKDYSRSQIVDILNCSKSIVSYHLSNKPKNKKKKTLCECGNLKNIQSNKCTECIIKIRRERLLNRTLKEIIDNNSNKFNPFQYVRASARILLKESGKEYKCDICRFSEHVEVCHIKPISSFPLTAKISEVNSLDNLVYLCPNHHILYDKGKLKLKNISH